MDQTSVIALLGGLVTLVGGVLGVWWRIEGRIKQAEKDAEKRAKDAELRADAAIASVQLVAANLADHKLHVAETYVTKSGLRETTEQIMTAIGDIKQSVNGLTTRLDRIIEDRTSK